MTRRMNRTEKNESGFTLLELIVVFAIFSILAGIAVPTFTRWLPNYRLRSAATDLFSNLQLAKIQAIRANKRRTVTFNPAGTGTYQKGDLNWVSLSDYGSNITYGRGAGVVLVPGDAGDADDISFTGNQVSFTSRGMGTGGTGGSVGYVYLTNNKGTSYAVGSSTAGVIFMRKWDGAIWQ